MCHVKMPLSKVMPSSSSLPAGFKSLWITSAAKSLRCYMLNILHRTEETARHATHFQFETV